MSVPTLLHVYPTFNVGGVQRRLADLINAWEARYKHVIVALDGGRDAERLLTDPDQVRFLNLPNEKGGLLDLPRRLAGIRRKIAEISPDVLLTFNFGAIEWALANRLSGAVGHLHFEEGFGVEESPERQLQRRVWLRRAALSGSHTTTVVVSHVLEDVASRIWKLPNRQIVRVPNGIHLERFAIARPATTIWRRNPEEILLAIIGGLRPEKNVGRLIRAMAMLASSPIEPAGTVRLVVVGEGPEGNMLKVLADSLGLAETVQFAGFHAHPEELLAEVDILAVSSDHEQMPLSVMEAMAAALPVVSTDVGDIRSMVAPENHPYIVPLDDSGASLADALARLTNSRDTMREIGARNAVKARDEFAFANMCDRTADLVDRAFRG